MAKLSARGRVELARVSRERAICSVVYTQRTYEWGSAPIACSLTTGHAGEHTGESVTSWEREERALMSDGKILSRLTVIIPSNATYGSNGRHDYGWKVRSSLKPGTTAEAWRAAYVEKGWV